MGKLLLERRQTIVACEHSTLVDPDCIPTYMLYIPYIPAEAHPFNMHIIDDRWQGTRNLFPGWGYCHRHVTSFYVWALCDLRMLILSGCIVYDVSYTKCTAWRSFSMNICQPLRAIRGILGPTVTVTADSECVKVMFGWTLWGIGKIKS